MAPHRDAPSTSKQLISPRGTALVAMLCFMASVAFGRTPGRKELESADTAKSRAEDAAENEAYKHFQFGNQFYQRGLLKEAIDSLRKATAIQPIYPEAYYVLALSYYDLNDMSSGIAASNSALAQNPLFTEAHNILGLCYAKQGRSSEALKEFQLVLADVSFPTPEVAHFNIGRLAWEKGAFEDSMVSFRRSLEINPQFGRAWYLLGDSQENLGMTQEAKASYLKSIELMPKEVGPRYRIGVICMKQGDKNCARQMFEHVRSEAPGTEMSDGAREYLKQLNFQ